MKKIMILCAAAVMAASCTEVFTDDTVNVPDGLRKLTVDTDVATRATYNDDKEFTWEKGDALGLYADTDYTSEGLAEAAAKGSFTFAVAKEAASGYAYFPASAYADGALKVAVAAGQTGSAGTLSLSNVVSVSESIDLSGESVAAALKIVTPVLRVYVDDSASAHAGEVVKSVSVAADVALCGEASWDFESGYAAPAAGENTVAATFSDVEAGANTGLYITLLPAEAKEITYTVTTDKDTYTFVSTKGATFVSNHVYTLHLDLNDGTVDAPVVETPEITAVTVDDGGDGTKFYLGKTVTITGKNLAGVTAVVFGGAEVTPVSVSDTEVTFIVPDDDAVGFDKDSDFEVATDVTVGVKVDGEDYDYSEKVTAYPFYYYSNVTLGIGSNSVNTFTDFARENSFFVPSLGRVISSQEFQNMDIDHYALNSGELNNTFNELVEKANVIKSSVSKETYYETVPYLFASSDSSGKLTFASPANSYSPLTRYYTGTNTASRIMVVSGTPVMSYRCLTDNNTQNLRTSLLDGTVKSLAWPRDIPTTYAPAYALDEATTAWNENAVMCVCYLDYSSAIGIAEKTSAARFGYLLFSEVTCMNEGSAVVNNTREGYVKFDFYWSRMLDKE